MTQEIEDFHSYVVALHNEEGKILGGGLLFKQDLVVTCSHVVRDIVGVDDSRNLFIGEHSVYVSRPFHSKLGNFKYKAVLKINRPDKGSGIPKDLSILRLTPPPQWRFELPTLIVDSDLRDHEALAIGFPADSDSSTESGYVLGGARAHDQWIQTEAKSLLGQEIRGGYSGCPVWDRNLEGIVGILTEADEERRVAYIIPMHHIAMLEDSIEGLQESGTDKEAKKITPPGLFRGLLDRFFPKFHYFLTQTGIFSFPEEHDELEKHTEVAYATIGESLERRTLIGLRGKSFDSRVLPRQPRQSFHSPIQQCVREIEGHRELGGESSATILALSKKSKIVKSLVSRILRAKEPLILLGEPGSGKSLTIDQARLIIADKNRKRVFPTIAIYAPLGEFFTGTGNVTDRDVADFVARCADPKVRPYLQDLRKHSRLIVFLDGMDEMSRQGYNEHVSAISLYARAGTGKAKTIVACRTADFSPRFQHRRLVILPFSTRQIRSYLELQFQEKQVDIDGILWSHKELARRLSQYDLSIDARVPYVLWMFSLFIRDRGKWPASRVELLDHCYTQKLRDYLELERCNTEIEDSQLDATFQSWGRIAFEIAKANQGIAISLKSLRNIEGMDEAIAWGRACGVLEQSLDLKNELVKFEHHRAEEFFTAYYLQHKSNAVDWDKLLDYPRWRETLVNLLLLGGGEGGLDAVEMSLEQAVGHNTEKTQDQRLLVERVEFAARMHTDFHHAEDFQQKLCDAVYNLAHTGNPITRIKMLELARRTPGVDVHKTAEPSLESNIDYLRTHAVLVASAADQEASKEYLPNQLFFAFASGTLVNRAREFLSIGKLIKKWQPASLIAIVFAAYLLLPIAQVITLSYVVDLSVELTKSLSTDEESTQEPSVEDGWRSVSESWKEFYQGIDEYRWQLTKEFTGQEPFSKIHREAAKAKAADDEALDKVSQQKAWLLTNDLFANNWFQVSILAQAALIWILVAIRFPNLAVVAPLGSGLIVLILAVAVFHIMADLDGTAFAILSFAAYLGYILGFPLIYSCLVLFTAGCLLLACAYAEAIKQHSHPRSYLSALWENHEMSNVLAPLLTAGGIVLMMLVAIPLFEFSYFISDAALKWSPQWITDYLLDSSSVYSFILVLPVIIVGLILYSGFRFRDHGLFAFFVPLSLVAALLFIYAAFDFLKELKVAGTALTWAFRIALVAAFIWLLFFSVRELGQFLRLRRISPNEGGSLSERLARYEPQRQSALLNSVSAQSLGLEPEDYLDALVDVKHLVIREPALSVYWRKRYEAEELVEQGRER